MAATIKGRLAQAIKNHATLRFNYEKRQRIVEPYHYGLLGEKEQLHCYQTKGESKSGGIPEWRNFQLSQIQSLSIQSKSHFSIRGDYNPTNANYSFIEKQIHA